MTLMSGYRVTAACLSEGLHQKALETAKTMLAMHYPLEDICKITGLTEAEIEQLYCSRTERREASRRACAIRSR